MPVEPRSGELQFRAIPSVSSLVSLPELVNLAGIYSERAVVTQARAVLQELRTYLQLHAGAVAAVPRAEELGTRVAERLAGRVRPTLAGAINGTGIVLHTGLGRARLSEEVLKELWPVDHGPQRPRDRPCQWRPW